MASSTSFEPPSVPSLPTTAHANRSRRKEPIRPIPNINFPESLITDRYSVALRHETLRILARKLSSLDRRVTSLVKATCSAVISGQLNKGDAHSESEAKRNLDDINSIDEQFNDIDEGRRAFGEGYLKDRHMIYFWTKAFSVASQFIDTDPEDPLSKGFGTVIKHLFQDLAQIQDCLLQVASDGVMDNDILYTVGERWTKAEVIASRFEEDVPKWEEVVQKLRTAQRKASEDSRNIWIKLALLWTTFAVTAVSNVIFFSMGHIYSPHIAGTTRDADFWFLLQSCVSQFFGIVWLVIPLVNNPQIKRGTWVLVVVIAIICTIVATPLYLYAPTEWSTFLVSTGSAIQAFLTLQLALAV